MLLGRTHLEIIGLLWLADLMLLPVLIPANAGATDFLVALSLWLVPTVILAGATWRWRKHART